MVDADTIDRANVYILLVEYRTPSEPIPTQSLDINEILFLAILSSSKTHDSLAMTWFSTVIG